MLLLTRRSILALQGGRGDRLLHRGYGAATMLSLVQVTMKISFICCHSTPNNPFRAEEVIDSSWKTWCSGYRRLRISCLPDLSSYSLGGRRAEEVIDSSSDDLVQRVQEASVFLFKTKTRVCRSNPFFRYGAGRTRSSILPRKTWCSGCRTSPAARAPGPAWTLLRAASPAR